MQESEALNILNLAQVKLIPFCKLINRNFKYPRHIKQIASVLERVERGELKRVIINLPPRHGKSFLCSEYFPAWYLGKNPTKQIITATYGQDLSDDFGRKVRSVFNHEWYPAVFPQTRLRADTQAMARMETTVGGIYYAVGAGGALSGRGADLLLIDDPVKNREEADSETLQTKIWEWYKTAAYTRLMPDAAIVLIMTRWNVNDLAGKIIKETPHENWVHIKLQAVSDDGLPLWPERYDIATLDSTRKTLSNYDWACLYQQDPIAKEGAIIKPEWLNKGSEIVEDEIDAIYIGVDPAISKTQGADETAIVVIGVTKLKQYIEIESIHGRFEFNEQVRLIYSLCNKYKDKLIQCAIEDVAYQKALAQVLQDYALPIYTIKADSDKIRRLTSVSHLFSQCRVKIKSVEMINQLLMFRGGTERNDLVDALVYALKIAVIHEPRLELSIPVINKEENRRKMAFKKEFERFGPKDEDVDNVFYDKDENLFAEDLQVW